MVEGAKGEDEEKADEKEVNLQEFLILSTCLDNYEFYILSF